MGIWPVPAKYDYIVVQAYPSGTHVHTYLGQVKRAVRRFSANLLVAVQQTLASGTQPTAK